MKSNIPKSVLQKSPLSYSNIFTARELRDKHFDPTWHAHPEYQIFLVLEGTGHRFIGNTVKSFGKGDLTFLGPNIPHLWRNEDFYFNDDTEKHSRGLVIYFNESSLGQLIEKEELKQLKNLFVKVQRGMEIFGESADITGSLMQEIIHLHGVESLIQFLKILDLLSKTKEYELLHSDYYSYQLKEAETNRINIVYNYAAKNFKRKILLEEVSSLLNMTTTSFSRYFTMKTSKSFSYFLTELRIRFACKLLATEEQKSIAQICYESGFNTLSNFNKQFKMFMSLTPKEYRSEFYTL